MTRPPFKINIVNKIEWISRLANSLYTIYISVLNSLVEAHVVNHPNHLVLYLFHVKGIITIHASYYGWEEGIV